MKIHIVKQGDSLFALSQKYGVPLQKIIEANPQISNPDVLAVGDKVKIPAAPVPVPDNNNIYYKHTVKQGDTLWKLSKAWGITLKDMIDANPQLKNPNALMIGEVVNIPKKGNTAPIQAESVAAPAVIDKTAIGGKTYTGPIENPPAAVSPVAEAVPLPAPVPNKAPEVMPIQEITHESKSLFVQISVPAQEAMTYEMPKEAHKTKTEPAVFSENKPAQCEKSEGYPGLNENPYFMNCPPVYPVYEPMGMMDVNAAPNFIQPAAFMPDCPPPFIYPGSVYPANEYPGGWNGWNPNMAPDYNNMSMPAVSPVSDNASFVSPDYSSQPVNLPWPSCGCGGMHIQPYPYEQPMQPMYNTMPVYGMPQAGMVSPYMAGMNSMPNAVSPLYEQPMVSNIPPYPIYPVAENAVHNRVPEIQVPELAVQEQINQAEASPAKNVKGGSAKAAAKVKTSSQPAAPKAKSGSKSRTNTNSRSSAAKKNKNPWISN
ncbi:LysM peptidoglycan-binding domain-containing protein [Paenibacillus sp. MMS20-IR301]|uniref:LysM peptidoglycan-binding domain-containing protein n=1 Tax=Paenibacillus sp. MMS20-IR301 TaxID=2895946 RepID=UPI0028E4A089|nr:LysM peptidoglycan-binding domain-containing protein [Paenibacillus sp. MMS20-IR301]WNS43608.1 LysM peptidoglycan-binding domain-containing protein [Paenibacillus sp. MMS20-IR301]